MSAVRTSLVLALAREYVEKGWTQHTVAKDGNGKSTHAESNSAVCWCSVGAVHAAGAALGDVETTYAFDALCDVIEQTDIAYWNDRRGRSKGQVLSAFAKAIALTIAEERK